LEEKRIAVLASGPGSFSRDVHVAISKLHDEQGRSELPRVAPSVLEVRRATLAEEYGDDDEVEVHGEDNDDDSQGGCSEEDRSGGAASGKYAASEGKKLKGRCLFRKVHVITKEPVGLLLDNGDMKIVFKGDLVSVMWLGPEPEEEEEEVELEEVEGLVSGEVRLSNGSCFANPDLESLLKVDHVKRDSPNDFTRFQLHKEQWVV
jgi:hypothetical protein